ncbi:peptidoglycan D,D-transpeptidase FtsI family protein [Fontivita pretiosa]|uniref:peptidoglycan D,D-transpeptidase FtsI family protein n=1 Tax=Fontivita pretiosa TaxID=2989684 RepID=UPI003D17A7FD
MFERRAKIFLAILCLLTLVLLARAVQVQVLERDHWREQAVRVMTRPELIETTRGRLLDRKGRVIAEDVACIDACVDFRAIPRHPDPEWVNRLAAQRLAERLGGSLRQLDRQARQQMLADECSRVLTDIRIMWETLAQLGGMSAEQMFEIRQSIVRRVEMRRRYVWYYRYRSALRELEKRQPSPWYQRWLIDDTQEAPEIDQFATTVAEQTQPHVVLRAISNDVHIYLGKNLDRFPGLVLQPSVHRYYPYRDVGAHLIGHLTRVTREDVDADPNIGNDLRRYWPNDLIGRTGLEALCEPLLRGSRGRIERYLGEDGQREIARQQPVPGIDVTTTIDIELQHDLELAFREVVLEHRDVLDPSRNWKDRLDMPGAAVVIDVPGGQVLAMVSHPSYDLNRFDELYEQLAQDDINRPLMNRATQFALEPGSTAKPIVGLGAVAQGLIAVNDTIECTGYLQLNGRTYRNLGRCWVASNFGQILQGMGMTPAHHPIPTNAPHPTGFLNLTDALERSCNVYFETLADRLGMEGLAYWFDRFGLGRPTGIGIAEASGQIPRSNLVPAAQRRAAVWFSGIGQSQVLATPIQMANVAATIARGGVWMRPRLVPPGTEVVASATPGPDRVDLKLPAAAIAAVREGMTKAVNSAAGTGSSARRDDLLVAGKTGSAQASPLTVPRRDALNRPVMRKVPVPVKDENGTVKIVEREVPEREVLALGTHAQPNPRAPWYRGTGEREDRRSHAWFIGFAPADDPKIAFAVMVEYGGGGGATAGQVARQLLDACVQHGYLRRNDVDRTTVLQSGRHGQPASDHDAGG